MTNRPTCHPERPLEAKGLCRPCYQRHWKRSRRIAWPLRACKFCADEFRPAVYNQTHCSALCQRIRSTLGRTVRIDEELIPTRSAEVAADLVRGYVERGCRRVRWKAATKQVLGPFYAVRKRGPLYLIRARLPESYLREEAA